MNLSTAKWAQWEKTQYRELLGLFLCVCIALCTIVANIHNIAQNRPDNFPSYPLDNHRCSDDVYLRERGSTGGTNHVLCLGHRHCDLMLRRMMTRRAAKERLCRSLPLPWNPTTMMGAASSRKKGRLWGNCTTHVMSLQLNFVFSELN